MIHTEKEQYHERAVSETIGFILIFGIMVTGIALVTLYGYPLLLKEQQNTNVRNMERNMIVLQNDLKSLTYKSVPYKETTMQINGGTLTAENANPADPLQPYFIIKKDNIPLNFVFTNGTSSGDKFYPGELRFLSGDNDVVIGMQNGAVNSHYFTSPGSVMLASPRWFYDDSGGAKTLVISLIRINTSEIGSVAQSGGIVTVRMKQSPLFNDIDDSGSFTVDVEYSDFSNTYNTAWRNFFNDRKHFPQNEYTGTDSALELSGINRLVVKSYDIEILNL